MPHAAHRVATRTNTFSPLFIGLGWALAFAFGMAALALSNSRLNVHNPITLLILLAPVVMHLLSLLWIVSAILRYRAGSRTWTHDQVILTKVTLGVALLLNLLPYFLLLLDTAIPE